MSKWNTQRLEQIIHVNPAVKLTKGEVYPFIDIDKVSPMLRSVTNEEEKVYDGQSCSKFCNGDTVFSRITPCLENRKIAKVNIDGQAAFGSTEFYIFRAKNGKSDENFVYYLTSSDAVVLPAINSMTGASGRQRADRRFIERIKLNIPDILTQKRIGKILSAYDELIENNNKRIKILEQMAENLYKEWFVRFRFPGHETTEFENGMPKGWQTKRLGEFGVFLDSGSRPKGGIDDTLIEGVPSLGAEAVGELAQFDYSSVKYIPHEFYDKMKRGKFDGNAILVYKDGAYIGKTTIFRNKFPFENFAANEHVFLMKSTNFAYQNYLYFTLHQKEYFYLMQNLNRNAAQPGLAQPDIKRIKIAVPTEDVVKRFNVVIEALFDEIFQIAKTNRNLIKQRDMLLPRLMSGKLEACEKKEKVLEFKPKKTFVEFKNEFKAAARKDGGLTEQDLQELYKAYCDDSRDE